MFYKISINSCKTKALGKTSFARNTENVPKGDDYGTFTSTADDSLPHAS